MFQIMRRICLLQRRYTEENTPLMQRRGQLVRDELPAALAPYRPEFAKLLNISNTELLVEGRDGTGRKSHVPWVRLAWEGMSPSANEGWYCVYLFRKEGDGVYLTLMHASTRWEHHSPRPRPRTETQSLVAWCRSLLVNEINEDPSLAQTPDLSDFNDLAGSYERSTAIAKYYPRDAMPSEFVLVADLNKFMTLLSRVYDATLLFRSPTSSDRQAEHAQALIGSPQKERGTKGQGFGLNFAERKAVEERAMKLAASKLAALGFVKIANTSAKKPYDFEAHLNGSKFIVEVKGTTGNAETILVTKNEVAEHLKAFPHNVLVIVDGIQLSRHEGAEPKASGGSARALIGWSIEQQHLLALAFQYRSPTSGWE